MRFSVEGRTFQENNKNLSQAYEILSRGENLAGVLEIVQEKPHSMILVYRHI
jgi:hypothetical protein